MSIQRKAVVRPHVRTEWSIVTLILLDETGGRLATTAPMLVSYETGKFGDAMEELGYPLTASNFDMVRTILSDGSDVESHMAAVAAA